MSNTFEILMDQLDMPLEMRSSSAFCMRRFKSRGAQGQPGLGVPLCLCESLANYFV